MARCSVTVVASLVLLGAWAGTAAAASPKTSAEIVAGRFVATPEQPDTIWYVHPKHQTRQSVRSGEDLTSIIERSGVTVGPAEFDAIADGTDPQAFDERLAKKLRGRLLLDPATGWQWFVHPKDGKRYRVRSAAQLLTVLPLARLGVSSANLGKIPTAEDPSEGDPKLRQRLKGRVLWHVGDGSLWYVSPKDRRRYPLADEADAAVILKGHFLGITPARLASIPEATQALHPRPAVFRKYSGRFLTPSFDPQDLWYVSPRTKQRIRVEPANLPSLLVAEQTFITTVGLAAIHLTGEAEYTETSVATARGSFQVKRLEADLSLPGMTILTVGGNDETCIDGCLTFSVGDYARQYQGVAAINGSYFCPGTSASCADKTESYYSPLFHSGSQLMINQEQVPTSPYPLLAFDTANRPYYYPRASEFGSPAEFQARTGATLQAAIANWPALIEQRVNVVASQLLDSGQRNDRALRVVLGVKGRTLALLLVSRATVIDAAAVAETFGFDYAINLDGGSSAALWRYGEYLTGPGRPVPNAMIIQRSPSV